MTKFQQAVVDIVNRVPYGKVVSYGQVALYVGMPRGARQVGWILRGLEGKSLPWWRVINNAGKLTIKGNVYNTKELQKKLLESEGVIISADFTLDIRAYRHIFDIKTLQKLKLPDLYINKILELY